MSSEIMLPLIFIKWAQRPFSFILYLFKQYLQDKNVDSATPYLPRYKYLPRFDFIYGIEDNLGTRRYHFLIFDSSVGRYGERVLRHIFH